MMIVVVVVFTLCWSPLNVLIIIGDIDDSIWYYNWISYLWFAFHWLAMSHTVCNPIIYCWMNNKFRDGLVMFMSGCPFTIKSNLARRKRIYFSTLKSR